MGYEQPTWGEVDPDLLQRICVLSPHFDDAAMGAGQLILQHPGRCTVVTVLGGRPPAYPEQPTEWDTAGGFKAGDDVVAVRREEDRAAMEVLGATPVWLEFSDHQYLAPAVRPKPADVVADLASAIDAVDATCVVFPMGLGNPDHVLTHEAARLVAAERPDRGWFAYEDAGYKHIPGLLAWRVGKLMRSGLWPTPALVGQSLDVATKVRAIRCYASQIAPLESDHALTKRLETNTPEQYWRLAPPPRGWERLADDI